MLLTPLSAQADDAPPKKTNAIKIATRVAKHYGDYINFTPLGICVWVYWTPFGPYTKETLEVDEHLPDLAVSVYNEAGDDPWWEANKTLDKLAQPLGNRLIKAITGDELTDGHNNATPHMLHNSAEITKSVDVIGSPTTFLNIPSIMLRSDTTGFMPYYQSAIDAVPSRTGIAEMFRPESLDPLHHFIGSSFLNHWAYEFPRSMTVTNDNDYKAAVSIALHAADIVTNRQSLHLALPTTDICGINCAVANVIEEANDKHEVWQEVYPNDKHVELGKSDAADAQALGTDDIKAGHGNYVFVIWRHYRGCIQSPGGAFLWATVMVPPTKKR